MKSENFVYWLQGFFELAGSDATLTKEQCQVVRNHLNMVFEHEIDPSFGEAKTELQKIHDKKTSTIDVQKLPLKNIQDIQDRTDYPGHYVKLTC